MTQLQLMHSSSTFSVSATSHQFLTESTSIRLAFLISPVFVIIYMPNPLVFPRKECLLWLSHWEMTKTWGFKIMKLQQKQPPISFNHDAILANLFHVNIELEFEDCSTRSGIARLDSNRSFVKANKPPKFKSFRLSSSNNETNRSESGEYKLPSRLFAEPLTRRLLFVVIIPRPGTMLSKHM